MCLWVCGGVGVGAWCGDLGVGTGVVRCGGLDVGAGASGCRWVRVLCVAAASGARYFCLSLCVCCWLSSEQHEF